MELRTVKKKRERTRHERSKGVDNPVLDIGPFRMSPRHANHRVTLDLVSRYEPQELCLFTAHYLQPRVFVKKMASKNTAYARDGEYHTHQLHDKHSALVVACR